jgi:excisionase family DNA binding protein
VNAPAARSDATTAFPGNPARSSDEELPAITEPVTWKTERLLTANEVAQLLHVPVRWVREHTRSGLIPSVQLGRYRRYRAAAIHAWVEEQEQGGAAWRRHRPRRASVPAGGTK